MVKLIWNAEDAHKFYFEQGKAEGRAEGIEQGRAEGKLETKFEMIKNLLLAKTPMKYIVQASGLSKEEILKIANQNKDLK